MVSEPSDSSKVKSCLSLHFFYIHSLIEAMETKIDLSFKLNEKNYMMWAFAMKNNFKGKKLWAYVMGIVLKPQLKLTKMEGGQEKALEGDTRLKAIEDHQRQVEDWENNHAKILAWFMNNIELKVCTNIAKFCSEPMKLCFL